MLHAKNFERQSLRRIVVGNFDSLLHHDRTPVVFLIHDVHARSRDLHTRMNHRFVNVHPALLPSFGGAGMYGMHVHEAVIHSGVKVSGATVHVVDEEYDRGPIVMQKTVEVADDDTPQTLALKVLRVEHEIFPLALKAFAEGRVRIEGRKAWIRP